MNFFDHKDLGNHLLQLCPKGAKHPVFIGMLHYIMFEILHAFYIEYYSVYLFSVIFTINYVGIHI